MQIIEYSQCLESIINLSIIAKEYYEYLHNANDKLLYQMSMENIKNKKYDESISIGVKERCMNIIEETWNNVSSSEEFYQCLLVHVSCNDIMIENLYNMFADMLLFCQERTKKNK